MFVKLNLSFSQTPILISLHVCSICPDQANRIYPKSYFFKIDNFDGILYSPLLLVFSNVYDVKSLGRYCVVSHCFQSLDDDLNYSEDFFDKSSGPFLKSSRIGLCRLHAIVSKEALIHKVDHDLEILRSCWKGNDACASETRVYTYKEESATILNT